MKITKTAISVFLLATFIGYVSVRPAKQVQVKGSTNAAGFLTALPVAETKIEQESVEEDDWIEDNESQFKTKLLRTGEFHGREVKAKSGETWLGLFKQGENYLLASSVVKIEKVRDELVDDKPNQKTGKSVGVNGGREPILLLKNANFLRRGKIKTVFYHETKSIGNNFAEEFRLNTKDYKLFVTTGKAIGESVDETSKLVLTDGKTEQIIYSQKRCDDCNWQIYWAGDLDSDGKLDLFLDLNDHYNVVQYRLFLSSQAEAEKLVKEIANFRIVGC